MLVKICGLRETDHVKAAIDAGADAIGFVFAQSVRQVSAEQAAAICENVPAQVKRVAVMLHPTAEDWQQVLRGFAPDVLQTDHEDFAALTVPDSVERWPVWREDGAAPSAMHTYIYEGARSGRGETVDWSRAAGLARQGNMILAGGLAADNVAAAIGSVRPFGVDVSSGVESSPGQKNIGLIKDFVRAARAAEKNV